MERSQGYEALNMRKEVFVNMLMQEVAEDRKKVNRKIEVVDRKTLNSSHIKRLARGECMILHVREFLDQQACTLIASGAVELGYMPYLNVPSVRRIGMAFYETEGKPELIEKYFSLARENSEQMRRACSPAVSPIDALRCTLDEIWESGANLQTFNGRKMFVGLSRMVEPGTTFLAHHDIFEQDAKGAPEATSVLAQFGANVYAQVPETGGELLMWDMNMSSEEFDRKRQGEYGLRVETLPPPDIAIKPSTGDLFIFDSRKMHAVAPPIELPRLALSCFIAYRGDHMPLTYWS